MREKQVRTDFGSIHLVLCFQKKKVEVIIYLRLDSKT